MWFNSAHGCPGVMGGLNDLRGLFQDDSMVIYSQIPHELLPPDHTHSLIPVLGLKSIIMIQLHVIQHYT